MCIGLQLACLKLLFYQSVMKITVGGLITFDVPANMLNNKPFCTWTVKYFL